TGLQRLDRQLLQGRPEPALRRRHATAAEHGIRRRGAATGREDLVLSWSVHPPNVCRGTVSQPSLLRTALDGTRQSNFGGRCPCDTWVEQPGMDLPRAIY